MQICRVTGKRWQGEEEGDDLNVSHKDTLLPMARLVKFIHLDTDGKG